MFPDKSLKTRLIVAGILVPLVVGFAILGNWPYAVFVAIALGLAGWEYWRLFRVGDFSPSLFLIVVGILSLVWMRYSFQFQYLDIWLAALILLSMTVAVFQQAQKVPNAAFNFAITISGILYVGWLGSYTISLRNMPLGLPWTLLVIFSASMSDTGAYLFGSLFGKHKISLALSPKKSWEGYFGGVVVAAVTTWLACLLCVHFFPTLNPIHGLIVGAVLAVFTPLGDFAESMLKRSFNIKDVSHILPGHGGILDRIDSSLWALPIGFYILMLLK
jgi:phosphatidate cytidylyltransferase